MSRVIVNADEDITTLDTNGEKVLVQDHFYTKKVGTKYYYPKASTIKESIDMIKYNVTHIQALNIVETLKTNCKRNNKSTGIRNLYYKRSKNPNSEFPHTFTFKMQCAGVIIPIAVFRSSDYDSGLKAALEYRAKIYNAIKFALAKIIEKQNAGKIRIKLVDRYVTKTKFKRKIRNAVGESNIVAAFKMLDYVKGMLLTAIIMAGVKFEDINKVLDETLDKLIENLVFYINLRTETVK